MTTLTPGTGAPETTAPGIDTFDTDTFDTDTFDTDTSGGTTFVNTREETVAAGLARWLIAAAGRRPACITLTTGFVTMQGLLELLEPLTTLTARGHQVRLLLGVAPPEGARIWRRARILFGQAMNADSGTAEPGRRRGHRWDARATAPDPQTMTRLCAHADRALRGDLAGMPLTARQLRRLQGLAALLADDRMQVRRYQRRFLHAKATVVGRGHRVRAVTGSSNLTLGGLTRNEEFNAVLGRIGARAALAKTRHWWNQARPYDLAALITELFCAYPRELVYLRMLAEAYDEEVNADPSPCMNLTDYQRDGVARVRAILRRYGGALIADEVGLGKTYIAGEAARLAVVEGRGPVTVVAPASLRRMWRRRLAEWGLNGVRVLSYDQLTKLYRGVLEDGHTWQRCGLLILDEAHAVRNPLTARMEALRSLLAAQPQDPAPPQVLLMSATPVNNTARDLFELLVLADRGLEPDWSPAAMLQRSRTAARPGEGRRLAQVLADPLTVPAREKAWYYQMAHERMLRRDRPLIRRAYPTAALRFPDIEQIRVDVPMAPPMQEVFAAVLDAVGYTRHPADSGTGAQPAPEKAPEQASAPSTRHGRDPAALLAALAPAFSAVRAARGGRAASLTLAAYRRACYRRHDPSPALPITGLLRSLLLKRMESSPAALAATARHMAATVRGALADLDAGVVRTTTGTGRRLTNRRLGALSDDADDSEAILTDLAADADADATEPADCYHQAALRADLQHDLVILQDLAARARAAVATDPKKDALLGLLATALADPRGPKIVIFASARETTHDLGRWLTKRVDDDPRLAALRGRVANLGSRREPRDTEAILAGFAPATASTAVTEATFPPEADRYDVLICTDKFAEGVNLQQAALCINYDLTWNPQRLGQRVGRLDRVGSTHDLVTCWTMLPVPATGAVLRIMDILHTKARLAAETVGVPAALYPDSPVRTYTDLLDLWRVPHTPAAPDEVFSSAPGSEEAEPIRDHGWATTWLGNARRTRHLNTALDRLPHGAGAVHPGTDPDPSVVFCFRVDAGRSTAGTAASTAAPVAAFAQVYAGARRAGHITLDTDRCLRHARIDLTDYITDHVTAPCRSTAGSRDPKPPLRREHLDLVISLLDRARGAVAQAHDIPADTAAERIQLICWMLLTPAGGLRASLQGGLQGGLHDRPI